MSSTVTITCREPGWYDVEVMAAAATTSHRVQVPDGMPEQLGAGPGGDEKLLRATFAFLLQREPA
ncbi:MAG: hypothetical protein ACYDH5_12820, partial [Acidimicrobiales bacterium]